MTKDEIIKAEILAAARQVFQKWGVKKTTMEDIAAAAGKAKSTLYYYFRSKEEIFDAAVVEELAAILARCKNSVMTIASTKEKLKAYVVTTMTEMKAHALQYNLVWEELKSNPRFSKKLRTQVGAQESQFYQELIELGVQRGEFAFASSEEAAAAARTISGIVRALFLHLFLETADSSEIDIAARLIANGI